MRVPELIARFARAQGLEHFFGLPGSGLLMDLMEEGRKAGLRFVSVAHESSAAVAAAYYGHRKGCAGLAVAIRGPGAANLASGAATAYFERRPVVCLCECSPQQEGTPPSAQICDHEALFSAVAKHRATLTAQRAAEVLRECFAAAAEGRPGPVLLDVPSGLTGADGEAAPEATHADSSPEPPNPANLRALAETLRGFNRPVVIAGADVLRARARRELAEVVERLGAAVLVATEARGLYPEDHPRFAGVFSNLAEPNVLGNLIMDRADGALLVGMDPLMAERPWHRSLPACELVARRCYTGMCPSPLGRVDGDLRASLGALLELELLPPAPRLGYHPESIASTRTQALRAFARPPGAALAVQDVIAAARRLLPAEGMLFSETGVFVLMLEHLWPVTLPDTFFGTAGGRTMGLMIPAILGAGLARPGTPMVGIGGDASTLMRLGELETFARARVAVPLVIVNDGCLGTIGARQKARALPRWGVELAPVDFAAVARGCGLSGVQVRTPQELERELQAAFGRDRATVLDVRVDPEAYRDSFVATTGAR